MINTKGSTIDRGDTVVQVVIAVPIVLTLLLIAVQAMLFMHSALIDLMMFTGRAVLLVE